MALENLENIFKNKPPNESDTKVNLAKKTGTDAIDIRFVEADTAQEARAIGALTNIAEGKGTALDAAKYFRDTQTTKEDLESQGVKITDKVANDGISLSNLGDKLFDLVAQGKLSKEKGVILGSKKQVKTYRSRCTR